MVSNLIRDRFDGPYRHLFVSYGWEDGPWMAVTYTRIDPYRVRSWTLALAANPIPGAAFDHSDAAIVGESPPDYSEPPDS